MSHGQSSSNQQTSKIARFSAAVREAWADARYADRRLMELRTNLTRHSG